MAYQVVSLYSGAGGMDYGFKLAGFDTIFANDIDTNAVKTFNRLIGDDVAIEGDIDELLLPSASQVDVVIGGPPCQGFSVAGKMDPSDPRSRHVWKFLEAVSQLRPTCFVMENVKALAVNKRWTNIRDGLITASESMGYRTSLIVLKASNFGVAQGRERMFLIGSLLGSVSEPTPTTAASPPTSRSILQSMPAVGKPGNNRLATAAITLAAKPVMRRSPFAGMMFNGAGRPINLDAQAPTIAASIGGNKTPIVDQRWLQDGGSDHWVKTYHEHLWNGGEPWAFDAAPDFLRRLTAEEAAALQAFPSSLQWSGPTSAVFKQVGNAVPPPLAEAVGRRVLEHLDKSLPTVTVPETPAPLSADEILERAVATQLTLV